VITLASIKDGQREYRRDAASSAPRRSLRLFGGAAADGDDAPLQTRRQKYTPAARPVIHPHPPGTFYGLIID